MYHDGESIAAGIGAAFVWIVGFSVAASTYYENNRAEAQDMGLPDWAPAALLIGHLAWIFFIVWAVSAIVGRYDLGFFGGTLGVVGYVVAAIVAVVAIGALIIMYLAAMAFAIMGVIVLGIAATTD